MEKIQEFRKWKGNVPEKELIEVCDIIQCIGMENMSRNTIIETIQYLSYSSLNQGQTGERIVQCLRFFFENSKIDILEDLIHNLKPMLPNMKKQNGKDSRVPGLNPQVGMSLKDDEDRHEWKARGGERCIPLMFTVLIGLKRAQVSSNLWWITPAIVNILDDTSDLIGVRLKGVFLIKTLLEECFGEDDHWISLHETGLYELYGPILFNMCYCLPPSYTSENSLAIWKLVFPTLNMMYRMQFKNNDIAYKHRLGKFLSQLLLQNVIPRVNITDEKVTSFALKTLVVIIKNLKIAIVSHLQRIIYTLGEYLILNAYFIAFPSLVNGTINVISALIEECPKDRLLAHKYDFLAMILLIFEKSRTEGNLEADTTNRLRSLLQLLEVKGCDLSNDKMRILKAKDMRILLT